MKRHGACGVDVGDGADAHEVMDEVVGVGQALHVPMLTTGRPLLELWALS